MNDDHLDRLIDRLNHGDLAAAERALLDLEPYLRMVIRRQLGMRLRTKLDSTDILQSVWADILMGLKNKGWHFADHAQWRAFLVRVASHRLVDRHRQLRQALAHEQPLESDGSPCTREPRASEVAQGQELWERILAACPPAHREIVRLRRQGYALAEIASRTGLHPGSVRRILYELARRLAIPGRTGERSWALSGEN